MFTTKETDSSYKSGLPSDNADSKFVRSNSWPFNGKDTYGSSKERVPSEDNRFTTQETDPSYKSGLPSDNADSKIGKKDIPTFQRSNSWPSNGMDEYDLPKGKATTDQPRVVAKETVSSYTASDDADSIFGKERNNCRAKKSHSQPSNWLSSGIFSGPRQLIYTDSSGHLAIEDEILCQISAIPWQLVIVGIAGPYRCGKSYLMNRLAERQQGFFVGNSTDAATKGIWVLCKIHPTQKETVLLMLDTEGLNDIRKGNKDHDNKILTLITLLCNVLIYNMTGRFDEDSMSKLSFASKISKWVKFGNDPKQQDNLPLVMPELILCLRDFFLNLGEGINSPTEYFESCLKDIDGKEEYNAPRQSLKTYFQRRDCFIFPMPAEEDVMGRLEKADEKELKQSFLQKTEIFKKHVYGCLPKSMLNATLDVIASINGPIFKTILEYHVSCLKRGQIPNIEDAFLTATKVENEKIMKEAINDFREKMKEIHLPAESTKDFRTLYVTSSMECLQMFRENVKMDKNNEQEKELQIQLHAIWDEMKKENSRLLQAQFADDLQKRFNDAFKRIKSEYNNKGGYRIFKARLEKMKKEFDKDVEQTEESELAWRLFTDSVRETEMDILNKDRDMTQAERERQMSELIKKQEETIIEERKKSQECQRNLEDEIKQQEQIQQERDEAYKQQIEGIKNELRDFKTRGFAGRFKYLFTGK